SDEGIAACGWSTLSSIASIKKDEELDLDEYRKLMKRVERDIHTSANRVRYTMNGFVIAVGGYITSMKDIALATANKIGKIDVKMGGTACKVPSAAEYIDKVVQKGYLGKKRKTAVC